MEGILGVIVMVIVVAIMMAVILRFVVGKSSRIRTASVYTINAFEPDNTAPKITELVDYYKAQPENKKYIID